MKDRKILALILVIVLVMSSFTFAFGASEKWSVQGWNKEKEEWTTGNLGKGWYEGDNVNFRIAATDYAGTNDIIIDQKYMSGSDGPIGFDEASDWKIVVDNVVRTEFTVSGPDLIEESNEELLRYVVTLSESLKTDLIAAKDFSIEWLGHLSETGGINKYAEGTIVQGSSYWSGSSLHISTSVSKQTVPVNAGIRPVDPTYEIDVTKIADQETDYFVGDVITYTIKVTNKSNVTLSDIVVVDDMYDLESPITLSPNTDKTYTVTVSAIETGEIYNTVTASSIQGAVSDTATAVVNVIDKPVDPTYEIEVTKVADKDTDYFVGDVITYKITVTNKSNVTLDNIVVEDNMYTLASPILLVAGASREYTITTAALVAGPITNIVTASSIVGDVSDTASLTVNVIDKPEYSLSITKTANPTSAAINAQITYTIKVKNTGSEDLTNILVKDIENGISKLTTTVAINAGQTETFYVYESYATSGLKTNTASAEVVEVVDVVTAQAIVNILPDEPTDGILDIYKDVKGDLALDTDVFTFTIYPDLQLQPVSMLVPYRTVTASAITKGSTILPAGDYIVVETGFGDYTSLTTPQSITITAGQVTDVTFENELFSSIKINKIVTGNRAITSDPFEFEIEPYYYENGYDVRPSVVEMPVFPIVVTASAISSGYSGYLHPGPYLVTETDPSPYNLTARSSDNPEDELYGDRGIIVYVGEGQTVLTFTNRYNIPTPPPPSNYEMEIEKTANAAEVSVGDVITYTIIVKNTGNRTLTNIAVKDEMVDLDEVISNLAVGASQTFIVTYETTEEGMLENTATATNNLAPAVQDSAIVFVEEGPPQSVPGLVINKTVEGGSNQVFNPGNTVKFKILVTNTGNEKLENILVADELAGFLQSIPSLDIGQSQEFIVSVKIDKDFSLDSFENIATATNNEIGTIQATATVLVKQKEIVVPEEETPLAIPDTGSSGTLYAYGAGAMLSLIGLLKKKRR